MSIEALQRNDPFSNSQHDQAGTYASRQIEGHDGPAEMFAFQGQANHELVSRTLNQLRLHPLLVETLPAIALHELERCDKTAEVESSLPICISLDNFVLEGFKAFKFAQVHKRQHLQCVLIRIQEQAAISWIIRQQLVSKGLNAFLRISLALKIEPWLKEQAKQRQRLGGQLKGSSNLTEAERIDVRAGIASLADVSTGNVTKVRRLRNEATANILKALGTGELRIGRAYQWRSLPSEAQENELKILQSCRESRKTLGALIRRHPPIRNQCDGALKEILTGLRKLETASEFAPLRGSIADLIRQIARQLETR